MQSCLTLEDVNAEHIYMVCSLAQKKRSTNLIKDKQDAFLCVLVFTLCGYVISLARISREKRANGLIARRLTQ